LRRFRRIDITLPAELTSPIDWGGDVLQLESTGSNLVLVHPRYTGDESLASIREKLPPGSGGESSPMSLRDIYLTLARNPRRPTP